MQKRIAADVLSVLSSGVTLKGDRLTINAQLDRKLYTQTNDVLEALGWKWNKREKAHVYQGGAADASPVEALEAVVESGLYVSPKDVRKMFAFFPTPASIADEMVRLAGITTDSVVLEPSAGNGSILLAMQRALENGGARPRYVQCVEIQPDKAEELRALNMANIVVHGDFTGMQPLTGPRPDVVLMNPPFLSGQDVKHVLHAYHHWLVPGGRLVAITSPAVKFREGKAFEELRTLISKHGSMKEQEVGAFAESGTEVRTLLIVINKPGKLTRSEVPAEAPAPAALASSEKAEGPWDCSECKKPSMSGPVCAICRPIVAARENAKLPRTKRAKGTAAPKPVPAEKPQEAKPAEQPRAPKATAPAPEVASTPKSAHSISISFKHLVAALTTADMLHDGILDDSLRNLHLVGAFDVLKVSAAAALSRARMEVKGNGSLLGTTVSVAALRKQLKTLASNLGGQKGNVVLERKGDELHVWGAAKPGLPVKVPVSSVEVDAMFTDEKTLRRSHAVPLACLEAALDWANKAADDGSIASAGPIFQGPFLGGTGKGRQHTTHIGDWLGGPHMDLKVLPFAIRHEAALALAHALDVFKFDWELPVAIFYSSVAQVWGGNVAQNGITVQVECRVHRPSASPNDGVTLPYLNRLLHGRAVTVNREALETELTKMAKGAEAVLVNYHPKGLILESVDAAGSVTTRHVPGAWLGDSFGGVVVLNVDFVLDALQGLPEDEVILDLPRAHTEPLGIAQENGALNRWAVVAPLAQHPLLAKRLEELKATEPAKVETVAELDRELEKSKAPKPARKRAAKKAPVAPAAPEAETK